MGTWYSDGSGSQRHVGELSQAADAQLISAEVASLLKQYGWRTQLSEVRHVELTKGDPRFLATNAAWRALDAAQPGFYLTPPSGFQWGVQRGRLRTVNTLCVFTVDGAGSVTPVVTVSVPTSEQVSYNHPATEAFFGRHQLVQRVFEAGGGSFSPLVAQVVVQEALAKDNLYSAKGKLDPEVRRHMAINVRLLSEQE